MLSAAVLMILSSLMYSLQLSTGSFPKPLSQEEEAHYLALSAQGDLDARNLLIERNLRLVAHVMNNDNSKRKGNCLYVGLRERKRCAFRLFK